MTQATGLTARVAGKAWNLNDDLLLRLLDYDLGPPPVRRLSRTYPTQHGDTDTGYRYEPRFLNLFWGVMAHTNEQYMSIRRTLAHVFAARDEAVQLTFDFGYRRVTCDAVLDGTLLESDRIGAAGKTSGIFKCSDPRFYDPDIRTQIFNLASAGSTGVGWEIPWEIPWDVAPYALQMSTQILYAADFEAAAPEYPRITIRGPVSSPIIVNETTGEQLNLGANGGLELAGGEMVQILLNGAYDATGRDIVDAAGDSLTHFLTADSDFGSWHLAPPGERLSSGGFSTGLNVITVTGLDVSPASQITINYHHRYWSA